MPISTHDQIRILVVDDEEIVREPLTEALGWVGYTADGAASVDEAVELLNQRKYDLLFCDLVMPGANGFTLLDIMRRRYANLPVIVLTGHATVDLTQKAIRLGAQDFIIKPFSVRELPFIVERNLERVQLETQIRAKQTENLLFQTVQSLTAAIEAKDPYTAGHSQKVAQLAIQFSALLNLDSTDAFVLRLAGLLHDVGKIGIPESILLKPGQLNEHEWSIMKQHPIIGAEIVGQISDLGYVAKVVRSHHERWDGQGYPDGLRGDAIPFLSRILYISDAYDALTADRAYRKGMSHEQALDVVMRQTGSHFDTELARVMMHDFFPSYSPSAVFPNAPIPHLSRTTCAELNAQEQRFPVE